jgi:hypothetical protein
MVRAHRRRLSKASVGVSDTVVWESCEGEEAAKGGAGQGQNGSCATCQPLTHSLAPAWASRNTSHRCRFRPSVSSQFPELRYTPCTCSDQEMRGRQTWEAVPPRLRINVSIFRPSSSGSFVSDPRPLLRFYLALWVILQTWAGMSSDPSGR